MSTTVMQVPAHIAARSAARKAENKGSAVLSAVVSGDGVAFPRVSIRAGRYRLVEDGVETVVGTNMDVIIVGASPYVSKVFYGRAYDPNATDLRPDCSSNDGIKPDASIENPVSSACATCPNNVLGSKVTPSGAKSKLCADQRHLAVVPAADPSKVYGFTITVSAMKGLREYFKHLQNYNNVPEEVITELGFDESVSYPKVTFNLKGYVSEKALGKIDAIVGSDEVKEVTRVLPASPRAPALAAPAAAPAEKPAAKPAAISPPPAVEDGYEDDAVPASAVSQMEKALDGMFG